MARLLALAVLFASPFATTADPLKVDRTLKKEPAYSTEAPRYGLLIFGPEGRHRVWLVHDGDVLYVDRNGNGDLTEPGEKVPAEKPKEGRTQEEGEYVFELGELTVGGRTHKGVTVLSSRLTNFGSPSVSGRPDVKAALAKDPKTEVVMVRGDIDVPGMKGGGVDGRLSFMAGFFDLAGLLQFAAKPADAPVIHLGGPLEITFYFGLPSLRVGRESELILVVGTPGVGPGTFAMLDYEDTIPESARPVAEITYQPAKPREKPLKERFEIKDRC
jgi:hypothetical protein